MVIWKHYDKKLYHIHSKLLAIMILHAHCILLPSQVVSQGLLLHLSPLGGIKRAGTHVNLPVVPSLAPRCPVLVSEQWFSV